MASSRSVASEPWSIPHPSANPQLGKSVSLTNHLATNTSHHHPIFNYFFIIVKPTAITGHHRTTPIH